MKIGLFVNIPFLTEQEVGEELKFIKSTGVKHIVINYDHPLGDKLKIIESFLTENPDFTPAVHAPFVHTDLLSAMDSHRKLSLNEMKKSILFAKKISAKYVVFHTGNITKYTEKFPVKYDEIKKLIKFAKSHSIKLAVENLFRRGGFINHHLVSEKEIQKLLDSYPDLFLCLDIGHSIEAEEDNIKIIEKFHEKIMNLHIHDADKEQGIQHIALGKGSVDIKAIIAKLKELNFNGYLDIETLTREDSEHSYKVVKDLLSKLSK